VRVQNFVIVFLREGVLMGSRQFEASLRHR
jgi:hypothetical protein